MKKIISIALIVSMLTACFTLFASANESSVEKVNAALGANVIAEADIMGSIGKHVWDYVFDGAKIYNADDASTYCDTMFGLSSDKPSILDGTYSYLYNHLGEQEKADSKYYFYVTFDLRTTYILDSIAVYAQIFYPDKGVANMNSFDGFDIWASKDGADYTLIHSVSDLVCGKKWTAGDVDPNTAMYRADLEASFEARYITFCISQPRCFNAEFAAQNDLSAATNVQYFRLTEIETLGYMTGDPPVDTTEEVTTEAPDTTKTPDTAKAPDTTKTPDTSKTPDTTAAPTAENTNAAPDTEKANNGGCGGFIAPFGIVAILMGAACLIVKKKD